MKEIKVGSAKSYTVPDTATKLTIVHEWGDVVVNNASVTTSYSFTPDSIGVHTFRWTDGTNIIKTDHYEAVVPYVSATEFFETFPELEATGDDAFPLLERKVRRIVNNYCEQRFGPYVAKTLTAEGQGGDSLTLPYRITKLTSIVDNVGTDYTDIIEISPNSEYVVQRSHTYVGGRWAYPYYYSDIEIKQDVSRDLYNLFSIRFNFTITGDFGWPWVPQDVTEASMLLIADELNGDNDMRKAGYTEGQLGDFSFRLSADFNGTTGNTQADQLLSPFVLMNIGLV